MRWSELLIPTLKEVPSDAEIYSHQLLVRAGLVRKLTGGLYTFLPMGLRILRKVENIVREEMNRAGALEVLMPALQPPEIWQKSGRYETAKDVFFKARDRAKKEWILGPTHEEVITTLVASEINSYRQLPKNFYQIQTKFRDEIRPRFGLMRAKEFIMKDAYSFDTSDEASQVSYQKMYDAYVRIFKRCGLLAMPVEADTGAMGGKFSHEFMVPAETGESDVAYCETGDYAANVEKAASKLVASTPSTFTIVGGSWSAVSGRYVTPACSGTCTGFNQNLAVHNTAITGDFVLTVDAIATSTTGGFDDFSVIFNYQNSTNYYYASFNETDGPNTNGLFEVVANVHGFAGVADSGERHLLVHSPHTNPAGGANRGRIVALRPMCQAPGRVRLRAPGQDGNRL